MKKESLRLDRRTAPKNLEGGKKVDIVVSMTAGEIIIVNEME
jgi:hypothetical protein